MTIHIINFNHYQTIDDFHKDIAGRLSFDAYYGANLDALHDLISELDPNLQKFAAIYGGPIPLEMQQMVMKILNQEV